MMGGVSRALAAPPAAGAAAATPAAPPSAGSGLSLEQKKKLLWGGKKTAVAAAAGGGDGSGGDGAPAAPAVFGANRWDQAELGDEASKLKFLRLMVRGGALERPAALPALSCRPPPAIAGMGPLWPPGCGCSRILRRHPPPATQLSDLLTPCPPSHAGRQGGG